MPSSSARRSLDPNSTVNLYCTNCNSQVGIYENEWIRQTHSYVIAKEKGISFATEVSEQSQTSDAKNINALAGCELSEASCAKCSKLVGQYCRAAPGRDHLVGQYAYKMSKISLKDTRTFAPVTFNVAFEANNPNRARSMFTAPPGHAQSLSPLPRRFQNRGTRRSMAPPETRFEGGFRHAQSLSDTQNLQNSAPPNFATPSEPHHGSYLRRAQSPSPYPHVIQNQTPRTSIPPPDSRFENGAAYQPGFTLPVSNAMNDQRMTVQPTEPALHNHIDAYDITAILGKIAEHNDKLWRMSDSVDHLKIMIGRLVASFRRSERGTLFQGSTCEVLEAFMEDFESMVESAGNARAIDELETLRAENATMKARLQTIASVIPGVMVSSPATSSFASPLGQSNSPTVLGKRKRLDPNKRSSLLQHEVAFADADEDELNDQSDEYEDPKRQNTRSNASTTEKASTSASLPAKANAQYQQLGIASPTSTHSRTGTRLDVTRGDLVVGKPVPTPPSSNTNDHDSGFPHTAESDHSEETEQHEPPQILAAAAVMDDPDTASPAERVDSTEKHTGHETAVATLIANNDDDEGRPPSSQAQRPQRTRKPASKLLAAADTEATIAAVAGKIAHSESAGPGPNIRGSDLRNDYTNGIAANRSKRNKITVFPQEAAAEIPSGQANKKNGDRRKTTSDLPSPNNGADEGANGANSLRRSLRRTSDTQALGEGHLKEQKQPPTTLQDHKSTLPDQPAEDEDAICEKCLSEDSTKANAIVFCDGCNRCWHMRCHQPRINPKILTNSESQWFCRKCAQVPQSNTEDLPTPQEETSLHEETTRLGETLLEGDTAFWEETSPRQEKSPAQGLSLPPAALCSPPPKVASSLEGNLPTSGRDGQEQHNHVELNDQHGIEEQTLDHFRRRSEKHFSTPQAVEYNKENQRPNQNLSVDGSESRKPYRWNRDPNRPKRHRRKPEEVERRFRCLHAFCTKSYGSLPHLNTHIVDSAHGDKWSKVEYDKAAARFGSSDTTLLTVDGDSTLSPALAAAIQWDQERREREARLDRMAKDAMEMEDRMAMAP